MLSLQHGETALHLAAKYNHSTVISVFASFKINLNIRGKVHIYIYAHSGCMSIHNYYTEWYFEQSSQILTYAL